MEEVPKREAEEKAVEKSKEAINVTEPAATNASVAKAKTAAPEKSQSPKPGPSAGAPSTSGGERHKRCRRQKSHSGQRFDHQKGNKKRTQSSSGEEKNNTDEQNSSGGGGERKDGQSGGGAAGQKSEEEQKNVADGGKSGAPNGRKKKPRRRRRAGKERPFQPHNQHKWKPYFKLTWAEKKALEERESKRALRVREEAIASGHPLAPYNTTQFIMEDRINSTGEPKLTPPPLSQAKKHKGTRERRCSAPGGCAESRSPSSKCECGAECEGCNEVSDGAQSDDLDLDCDYSDNETDLNYWAKEREEFSQAYDTVHAEILNNMPKNQLVVEYMELESKLEEMTKKIHRDDSPPWPAGQQFFRDGNDGPFFDYGVQPSPAKQNTLTTQEEMATLREKVEVLEKENIRMKEEMRRLSALNSSSSNRSATTTTTTTAMEMDDGGGGQADGDPYD